MSLSAVLCGPPECTVHNSAAANQLSSSPNLEGDCHFLWILRVGHKGHRQSHRVVNVGAGDISFCIRVTPQKRHGWMNNPWDCSGRRKPPKKDVACRHAARVMSSVRLEDAAVQFVLEWNGGSWHHIFSQTDDCSSLARSCVHFVCMCDTVRFLPSCWNLIFFFLPSECSIALTRGSPSLSEVAYTEWFLRVCKTRRLGQDLIIMSLMSRMLMQIFLLKTWH